MKELVITQPKKKISINLNFLKHDIVFTISLILALSSCVVQTPKLEYINLEVMVSLFNLMIAIKALEELLVLDKFAISILSKSKHSRTVSAILIFLSFISSMFVTNDVALLTFVPLTLIISKKTNINMMETVILQTIAANIGSSITPMGNPQNLYIFSHYKLEATTFFSAVLLIGLIGLILLLFSIKRLPNRDLKLNLPSVKLTSRRDTIIWGIVLSFVIASIFGLVSQLLALLATLLVAVFVNRSLLIKIDYILLITFVCFFIFIGNVANLDAVHSFASGYLTNRTSVYFSSIFLSQFISNVPASILLSNFTGDWQALMVGVNIGGLGTLVASLASVISYKQYILAHPNQSKAYLVKFSLYNFSFLFLLILFQFFILSL
ncbi:anion transporter [Bacillus sp. DNRA2]|uniref:SLC13 family permease n=1 Tax=Bacillus sp. DNRA2 TaxID=2723053 RepID=UPI00145F822E|nr:SLC13 family permease [Bacillus sp. DNRA2]NMD71661.1 anion transporter [Bacillus sp. DNRA2]